MYHFIMIKRLCIIGILTLLAMNCSRRQVHLPATGNAVYYWRTDFRLDSTEQAFLRHHHIRRIYCRYFDVVNRESQGLMPNATITFSQGMPDSIEMVPTVFITEDCMRQPHDSLAALIVRRIAQMNETNDIKGVSEIQIDCDYTARSRQAYYDFLNEVRAQFSISHSQFSILSTTIRLHQLSMPPPPADYGVLMLYNTGAPERFAERNPILDFRDVQPYVRYLKHFTLPLAAAYPVFQWQRIIHGANISHEADIDDILRTKQAVEAERTDVGQLIMTYHLDTKNIQRYDSKEYETIYHH